MLRFSMTVLIVAALGCGSSVPPPVKPHPVRGQVLYLEKPAEGVLVYMLPVAAPTIPEIPANPRGVTGPDGQFQISTFAANDGAAEGSYQIMLRWPLGPKDKDRRVEGEDDKLLGWYDGVNSRLTAFIKPGENVLPTIKIGKIKGPPDIGSEGVPGRN